MSEKETGKKEKQSKLKRPTLAFVICLGISMLLWLFVKLSREYTVTYNYDVTCMDVPKGKQVEQLSDSTLMLTFKGKGFVFLTPQFLARNRHIEFSIRQLYKTKGSVETTQFTQNELTDYLKEYSDLSSSFLTVEEPAIWFVYIK